ncbi:glycoside hydrolase family 2 protein [Gemmiger formicilis]|mgnify:FL=1|jgi:beta-galactosidase|uniref:glycoside hydrolase family 2 protein n=1 Tax=Gemmiger formicilis TaxID=745368 RepID=UPI0039965946
MRSTTKLMKNWQFTGPDGKTTSVDLPHTWNNIDGQDGGNDYWRGTCIYKTRFAAPAFDKNTQQVWLQFEGVNASAKVTLNGVEVAHHDGGYSTFRADVTALLADSNELIVEADNSKNDRVYPQKADFTFYGGIYRDVSLLVVNRNHIALDYLGGSGVQITPTVNGANADIEVKTWMEGDGEVEFSIYDAAGAEVLTGKGRDTTVTLEHPHLWDGVRDPYLYTCAVRLVLNGEVQDEVRQRFGVRSFSVDPKQGFFLNGRPYPLHGVSRHQDRKGLGNAITREMHDEDMQLIKELGANTIRLAHYQHDQYFYDLCDEAGMVVWAEIPYISEHMPNGRENTISQMKELIVQNYNHACIVCWGVSNEITISTKDNRDMRDNHHVLNDLCHEMDKTRLTTLACYAMCGPFNPVAHITDLVSWNLYLGWYVPGLFLNDLWMDFFHLCYPNRALGFSEYGAEGMPNLHSSHPRRGDHTEEYQAIYHEYMLRCFDRHKWLWATHVWNMYDFAADARDQGGEPGMNHKGLVTFDRKTKKDSFYIYKAWWSDEPFVHICSKRYADRTENEIEVKVYSNQKQVSLYVNGEKLSEQEGEHIFKFRVKLNGETKVQAVAGDSIDDAIFRKVDAPNPDYKLTKKKSTSANWV